jgi:hypothetical protein
MSKEFEDFIVEKVLKQSPDHWFKCFEDFHPVGQFALSIRPKLASLNSSDENNFKITAEFNEINLKLKVYFGQTLKSCQFMENEKTDDFIINFVKFKNSKEDSFFNYFEKMKELKKVVTILVSHQKVGVQFSGSSKFKEYSKNYDNIEFMEENNLQYVKNIGSRKRPRYTTSVIQVKRVSPKCKTCGKPTKGHKKSGCK